MIEDASFEGGYDYEPEMRYRKGIKPKRQDDLSNLVEVADQKGLVTTYRPARFEEGWLYDSLAAFYEQNLITDILASIKGGKEASVYRCAAHPNTGATELAAKVYRPRRFRNLRNDAMYREGRAILTADGRPAKRTDHRLMRAIGKKTEFGVQAQHTSWLMFEYTTLESLFKAGAAVPRPYGASENAILMDYIGDENTAAPTLSEIGLEPEAARLLLIEVLRNIELLLSLNLIHGDLSAYNILYHNGKITLIDFPQVSDCHSNPNARFILQRDVQRISDYFSRQGVDCDPDAETERLWERYVEMES